MSSSISYIDTVYHVDFPALKKITFGIRDVIPKKGETKKKTQPLMFVFGSLAVV